MNIYKFWKDVLEQNADNIKEYFDKNAYINWHCTNEHFNVNEFIIANCEYPGSWNGEGIAPKWRLDKHIGTPIKRS